MRAGKDGREADGREGWVNGGTQRCAPGIYAAAASLTSPTSPHIDPAPPFRPFRPSRILVRSHPSTLGYGCLDIHMRERERRPARRMPAVSPRTSVRVSTPAYLLISCGATRPRSARPSGASHVCVEARYRVSRPTARPDWDRLPGSGPARGWQVSLRDVSPCADGVLNTVGLGVSAGRLRTRSPGCSSARNGQARCTSSTPGCTTAIAQVIIPE